MADAIGHIALRYTNPNPQLCKLPMIPVITTGVFVRISHRAAARSHTHSHSHIGLRRLSHTWKALKRSVAALLWEWAPVSNAARGYDTPALLAPFVCVWES